MKKLAVNIINFEDRYTDNFAELNFEWLKKYFYIEDYDRKVLTNPRTYILDAGGHIFLALAEEEVVGTVALIKRGEGMFELSKMAVTSKYQGLKIGQKLMDACLTYVKENEVKYLFLETNTKLAPAIALYKKNGFVEVPSLEDTPYERSDMRMEWREF